VFTVGFQVRLFGIGQADLRAGLGLGVEEAASINTIGTAPQMLVAPCVPWLATTFGVRRILVVPGLVYAVVSFAIPYTHDYNVLAALSLANGLLLSIFVPATLLVTMRQSSKVQTKARCVRQSGTGPRRPEVPLAKGGRTPQHEPQPDLVPNAPQQLSAPTSLRSGTAKHFER
jgi:MFS family permease